MVSRAFLVDFYIVVEMTCRFATTCKICPLGVTNGSGKLLFCSTLPFSRPVMMFAPARHTRSVRPALRIFSEKDGTLEPAQRIAGHADSRTTKYYDRRGQKYSRTIWKGFGISKEDCFALLL
jgi:hypothetical protein